MSAETETMECIDDDPGYTPLCRGPVKVRMSLSGTGIGYPRCEAHWDARLDREEELNRRYPSHAPSDWSPYDAGETWDEDY